MKINYTFKYCFLKINFYFLKNKGIDFKVRLLVKKKNLFYEANKNPIMIISVFNLI